MAIRNGHLPSLPTDVNRPAKIWKNLTANDTAWVVLLGVVWLALLTIISALTAGQYGFHRDELNFIDNARHLAWGYVEYPPLAPSIGWVILGMFGPSLVALRFAASLAVCAGMVLTGWMVHELGGSRLAQGLAALLAGTAPVVLFTTRFFSYQTFDYLWWVLVSYLMIRLLKSENPRWWLAIGAVIGLGMLTKYSIPFLAAGIGLGMLLTPVRRDFKSPWFWAGVGLGFVIWLPNLLWQVQHDFISLQFQASTHSRDVAIGRSADFLIAQLYNATNPASIPLWFGGLSFSLLKPDGKRYRMLAWMYLTALGLFVLAQGRFYYLAGAYPMLIAAGASQMIRPPVDTAGQPIPLYRRAFWQNQPSSGRWFYGSLIVTCLLIFALVIPLTPLNSAWWRLDAAINPELREEIGWPELVGEVERIYAALPESERATTAVLAVNYGEAAAVDLYGPDLGLPNAISPVDTYWLRGYGDPPPQHLIVLGANQTDVGRFLDGCTLAGHTPNPYNILNEETRDHPDIFLCTGPREPWPEFWRAIQDFG
jgi:4-amino-4-deoxy-L-arabinose transferase-like glycosyltransferase